MKASFKSFKSFSELIFLLFIVIILKGSRCVSTPSLC